MKFIDKLQKAMERNRSWVCVGLDVDVSRLPDSVRSQPDPILAFNRAIIDATGDVVCAYKPNLAFYLAAGLDGMNALQQTVDYIPAYIPIILDAKVGDIGSTAQAYARAIFDTWGFDAVTVNPYMGRETIDPFLHAADKGIFVLTRTTNPGAHLFQDLICEGHPLYHEVARRAASWNRQGNCGLVVGATYPDELRAVRALAPQSVFLVPGVGAQGGSLAAAVQHGPTADGIGPIINSSRGILYASSGPDFAQAAGQAADSLRCQINDLRRSG